MWMYVCIIMVSPHTFVNIYLVYIVRCFLTSQIIFIFYYGKFARELNSFELREWKMTKRVFYLFTIVSAAHTWCVLIDDVVISLFIYVCMVRRHVYYFVFIFDLFSSDITCLLEIVCCSICRVLGRSDEVCMVNVLINKIWNLPKTLSSFGYVTIETRFFNFLREIVSGFCFFQTINSFFITDLKEEKVIINNK